MRVDGLKQTQDDPDVHCQDVQIPSDCAPEDWTADSAKTQDQSFDGTSVFSGQAKRSRMLVVDLVNHLVQRGVMQGAMGPVVAGIFHDEEDSELVGHGEDWGERNSGCEAAELGEWVEEPNLGQLNSEMGKQHQPGAIPLFCRGRNFLL